MSERIDHEPAFILHTRPWRETSLIVDVFSRHHGRLGLVARGARRQTSSLKARLVSFQPLDLSWFGKNALRTLHAAEWRGGDLNLRGQALMSGFYLNELLLRLLPEGDAHEALFDRYHAVLGTLSGTEPLIEPILRRFEIDLLSHLGYAQPLSHTAEGETLDPAARYTYEPGRGVIAAHKTDTPPAQAATYSGRTLLDLAAGDLNHANSLAEGKLLMRTLLAHYLGDKPLATRQLLIDLQKL